MKASQKLTKKIRQIAKGPNILVKSLGQVTYKGTPLEMLVVQSARLAPKKVLITSLIHGNEPAGAFAALELIRTLSKKHPKNVHFTILPCINPYGFDKKSRFNGEGLDINRDFKLLKTQEAALVMKYLSGRVFDVAIDLHEDPDGSSGYYLYSVGGDANKASHLAMRVKRDGTPLESRMVMPPFSPIGGVVTIPYWASLIAHLSSKEAICTPLRLNGIAKQAYVIETPTSLPLKKRIALHELSIKELSKAQ